MMGRKRSVWMLFGIFAVLMSCEEILFEEDLKDKKVTLTVPGEGAVVAQTTVNFAWEAVEGATAYQLQIAKPGFEAAQQLVADTTLTETTFGKVLEASAYEWRVRAKAGSSQTGFTTAKFKIEEATEFSARAVSLSSPEDNMSANTTQFTLEWAAVSDATLYTIQLLDEENEVLNTETTADTEISITFPEGATIWQVRAEKGEEKTEFTKRTLTVDTEVPNKPVLTIPVDKSVTADKAINFGWTREAVTGATEFDSIYIYRDAALQELETKNRVANPANITLEANNYFWQVKAFDTAGNSGAPSDVFSLTIN